MPTTVLDFETYYDEDDCSVRILGNEGYFNHPNFDAYLLSVVSDEGWEWVGNPKEFDFTRLDGHTLVAANAGFDEGIVEFGISKGWWARPNDVEWHCVLDLCRYLRYPGGSLAAFVKFVLGHTMEKGTRDRMKGQRWETMTPEFREEATEYALEDSRWALKLWQKLEGYWPEWERKVAQLTRKICRKGLPMDEDKLEDYIQHLRRMRHDLELAIPWRDTDKLLSRKAFDRECRKHGIVAPASLAQDVPEIEEWLDEHAPQFPFIDAYRNWRRVNTLLKKYERFQVGLVNGRFHPGIKYAASLTRRWGGGSGTGNVMNLARGEMFGTNMRSTFKAPEGKVFVICDLAQIELRLAIYLAYRSLREYLKKLPPEPAHLWQQDPVLAALRAKEREDLESILRRAEASVELMRKCTDLYEVLGIDFNLWSADGGVLKDEAPKLRSDLKVVGLGVPFGAQAKKVAQIAKISVERAQEIIDLFFSSYPAIGWHQDYWMTRLQRTRQGKDRTMHEMLPSGNWLRYENVRFGSTSMTYKHPVTGVKVTKKSSGLLYDVVKSDRRVTARPHRGLGEENRDQAVGRDILADRMLEIDRAGWEIILPVHDEVVIEVEIERAEECLAAVKSIMSTPPSWMPDMPLDAAGCITPIYIKD